MTVLLLAPLSIIKRELQSHSQALESLSKEISGTLYNVQFCLDAGEFFTWNDFFAQHSNLFRLSTLNRVADTRNNLFAHTIDCLTQHIIRVNTHKNSGLGDNLHHVHVEVLLEEIYRKSIIILSYYNSLFNLKPLLLLIEQKHKNCSFGEYYGVIHPTALSSCENLSLRAFELYRLYNNPNAVAIVPSLLRPPSRVDRQTTLDVIRDTIFSLAGAKE